MSVSELNSILVFIEERDEAALDALQIRGAWDDTGAFVGYDYRNQAWIEAAAGIMVQA